MPFARIRWGRRAVGLWPHCSPSSCRLVMYLTMTGETHFNEPFLEEVRLTDDHRIGAGNAGWALAKLTLANERLNLARGGVCWGKGPTAADLFNLIRENGRIADPVLIQRAAQLYIEAQILETLDTRIVATL